MQQNASGEVIHFFFEGISSARQLTMQRTVLIGGSAGSLAAIRTLFEALPADCGVSYIVIQHQSPLHHSHLDEVISKWTSMPVQLASEGTALQPDHIYIGLPGHPMTLRNNILHLQDTSPDPHKPIDFLCPSLAAAFGQDAALVILSGTGHDGTQGARDIKLSGGIVIAQSPSSAGFDGMPLSIQSSELADQILNPDEIAAALCVWGKTGKLDRHQVEVAPALSEQDIFEAILALVREHSHNDMSDYKPNMLHRRIERRMGLRHAQDMDAYLKILRQNPAELDQLARDMLIGVTAFFRDMEAFQIIEQEVIPALCGAKPANEPVRVWLAGCSTGEEVYSIAIVLMEWFAQHKLPPQIQIFATDIDDAALEVARAGVYSKEALADMSAARLQHFFKEDRHGYRIVKAVRETIVFASHNLISDPPFSRLDMVVCRNLFIYLNNSVQKKLLGLFHFVLNPGGCLFLGSSESIGSVARHFKTTSKQWRIYQHLATAPRRLPTLPITASMAVRRLDKDNDTATDLGALSGRERLYRNFLDLHGPAQILVNSRFELLFVSGNTSPYLSVPTGQASHDLLKMVKPGLYMALRSAVNGAQWNHTRTITRASESSDNAGQVRIEVTPIATDQHQELLLVCFTSEISVNPAVPPADATGNNWSMQQLIQELNATREDFQRTIEQSRIASEEMTAANEEITAMNEELQSANEELESSKEELQSLNDELVTSNTSLDARVSETIELNIDLQNLLNSAETATLLLDEALCIRRYTPACSQLMRVIPGDVGRALDDVVRLFDDNTLSADCLKVMRGEVIPDREICIEETRCYLRRILPYRDASGQISGVVLTLPDITSVKQSEKLLHERAQKLQWQNNLLSRAAPVVGRDLQSRIIFWNKGAEDLYGWTEAEALGKVSHDLLQTLFPEPLAKIEATLMADAAWQGELTHVTREGKSLVVESQWTIYRGESGEVQSIIEVNNNISRRKQALESLRASEAKFHTMLDWSYDWEYWVGADERYIYMTPSVERLTGYRVEEFEQDPGLIDTIVFPEDAALWQHHIQLHLNNKSDALGSMETRIVRKNGEIIWVKHTCRPVTDKDGRNLGRRVTVRDITAQKLADEQIHELAYFDPLTRLPNRRLLTDRLGQALIASKRSAHYGVLMILDLDNFKSINDTQGHEIGDLVLIEVSKRLTQNVRDGDTVARLGGDEFILLLENLGLSELAAASQAETVAEKIRLALNQPYTLNQTGRDYFNTPSIGMTLFRGLDDSTEVLLKQADVALYQAKDAGRNLVRYFNPAMQAQINARIAMEDALRRGLNRQEFRLHYQPQVDQAGRVTGAEALIRWQNPEIGLVSPLNFIPIAEETGLIVRIGQWVLETACIQLKAWQNQPGCKHMQLAVNVSARQFHQSDFVEQVQRALQISGVDSASLKLELTESVVLENVTETASRMRQLIELGVSFSLDDFGTGYASLSYLKLLPLAQVKIDQSFVRDVPDDPNDNAIVQAILAMCKSLNVHVIAEGVETEAQRDFLLQNGCTAYQGYLFGKPVPIEEWKGSCNNL